MLVRKEGTSLFIRQDVLRIHQQEVFCLDGQVWERIDGFAQVAHTAEEVDYGDALHPWNRCDLFLVRTWHTVHKADAMACKEPCLSLGHKPCQRGDKGLQSAKEEDTDGDRRCGAAAADPVASQVLENVGKELHRYTSRRTPFSRCLRVLAYPAARGSCVTMMIVLSKCWFSVCIRLRTSSALLASRSPVGSSAIRI